jgi:hypothetical protein
MTDAEARSRTIGTVHDSLAEPRFLAALLTTLRRYLSHPAMLWLGFALVHVRLVQLGLELSSRPLADVTLFYLPWVQEGVDGGHWVGIDTPWVYPIVAILPMLVAFVFGAGPYLEVWLALVIVLDAVAFLVVIGFGRDRRLAAPGWWWLAFLLLLGPIAIGRLDSIAVPLAVVGVVLLLRRPRSAAVLLTLAAWIKVWPAALVAAAVIVLRSRVGILAAAALLSAVIVGASVALGGGVYVFGFITQLTGRGIEVEAPMGVFWLWSAVLGGSSRVIYDHGILAYEVVGPGILAVGSIVTVLLAAVVLGIFGLALVLTRRGVAVGELLPPLALTLTAAFLVFNKVGSPQYAGWLAVPVLLGLVGSATGPIRTFRVPAVVALVIAALTQVVYPELFQALLTLNPVAVLALTARNLLYVVILAVGVAGLLRLLRHSGSPSDTAATLAT